MLRQVEANPDLTLGLRLVFIDLSELLDDKVHDELLHILKLDHPLGFGVILAPLLGEKGPGILSDSRFLLLSRLELTLENNGDEEIQENERDDKHKADEIWIGPPIPTSVDAIHLLFLVSLTVLALESN